MFICPICHSPLPTVKATCKGRLPGVFGLVSASPGPCRSTPAAREAFVKEQASRRAFLKARDA